MSIVIKAYIVTLVITAIPTVPFLVAYRSKPQADLIAAFRYLAVIVGLLFSMFLLAVQPVLALIPIVMTVFSMACQTYGMGPRTGRLLIATAAIVLDLGYFGWYSSIISGLNEQLKKHPVVSLADRLEYERDVRAVTDFKSVRGFLTVRDPTRIEKAEIPTAINVDLTRLNAYEKEIYESGRGVSVRRYWMLSSLLHAHYSVNEQFILSAGFGRLRTLHLPYRKWNLELPATLPIRMPQSDEDHSEITLNESATSLGIEYDYWHRKNLINFAGLLTLGLVETREDLKPNLSRVVEFHEHAFRTIPEPLSEVGKAGNAKTIWQFNSVSLMSLLKHRPAAV